MYKYLLLFLRLMLLDSETIQIDKSFPVFHMSFFLIE